MGKSIIFIVGFILILFLAIWTRQSHDNEIRSWASQHGYSVVSIERVGAFNNDSPFWRREGDDLARVVLADRDHQKRTSFFRWVGWWGAEQAWKEGEKSKD